MNDNVFFDTNILIYLHSVDEPIKKEIVEKLLEKNSIVMSTQVINEFINVMTKKKRIPAGILRNVIQELTEVFQIVLIDASTIDIALKLMGSYNYSYFDSLIISSALQSNCSTLYSEDMHHSHTVNGIVKIVNPFNLMQ